MQLSFFSGGRISDLSPDKKKAAGPDKETDNDRKTIYMPGMTC
jgi:hypothetical protein